jgi:hypothetical protein
MIDRHEAQPHPDMLDFAPQKQYNPGCCFERTIKKQNLNFVRKTLWKPSNGFCPAQICPCRR